ncbi:MAG: acylphosphatase [Planctomycetes bacterium]|nr:acylphosphatase [Planctomycetota bacterium]
MRRFRFVVTGRVQGVGFRACAAAEARRLGVQGHVRNRRDGAVEGEAQGEPDRVSSFAEWLRRGPPFSQVATVDLQEIPLVEGRSDFEIRR